MRATIVGTILVSAGIASAAPIAVSNYSWLQVPDGVVSSYGNAGTPYQTTGGDGFGASDYFRWGSRVWIPNSTLTSSGAGDYWTTIKLDTPRLVEEVAPQFWTFEGTGVRRYKVEASLDGVSYSQIGSHDFGSMQVNQTLRHVNNVTDGVYQYIRIRLNGTTSQPGDADYQFGNVNRAGPGFLNVEPTGDGTLSDLYQVNWVNQPNFLTTLTNNGLDFNGNAHNNGLLFDNGTRTGDLGNFETGDYAEIDLKAIRKVGRSILVWQHVEGATSYGLQWSNDDVTYTNVTGLSAAVQHAGLTTGATEYTFTPVNARYFRVVNATGGGNSIFNQVLLYNVPEPTSLGLMSVGVMLLTRRCNRGV